MEKLFREFVIAIDGYGAAMAIDEQNDAGDHRDEIIALFIRACMTDFKHDEEV